MYDIFTPLPDAKAFRSKNLENFGDHPPTGLKCRKLAMANFFHHAEQDRVRSGVPSLFFSCLLTFAVAFGLFGNIARAATIGVKEVLSFPSTYSSWPTNGPGAAADITDTQNTTGWVGITLTGGAKLTLGWGKGFLTTAGSKINFVSESNNFPNHSFNGFGLDCSYRTGVFPHTELLLLPTVRRGRAK
jgi:hypothetical protein